jgi:hypothetical protein
MMMMMMMRMMAELKSRSCKCNNSDDFALFMFNCLERKSFKTESISEACAKFIVDALRGTLPSSGALVIVEKANYIRERSYNDRRENVRMK